MDPVTIISVIATSARLAKASWDLGEALCTFAKDATIIDTTLQNLVSEAKAVQFPCQLLNKLLQDMQTDFDRHSETDATRYDIDLEDTLPMLARQLLDFEITLDRLRQATEGICTRNTSSAKRAWSTIKLNLRRETTRESRSQLSIHLAAMNACLHILTW